jgi:hypothetical protein
MSAHNEFGQNGLENQISYDNKEYQIRDIFGVVKVVRNTRHCC